MWTKWVRTKKKKNNFQEKNNQADNVNTEFAEEFEQKAEQKQKQKKTNKYMGIRMVHANLFFLLENDNRYQ
ncbi:hypothetical protein NBRC111894_4232 [Sporolactobacillus inulinus]|uniref:Uncharacterized protein n=1 Tax=Sporolactobacillus inulinus TaxID=2078 RepID=A0A4Y1ZJQ9_9BACL|nr:hypothetical protein NBRC111894_4232 [Sporolactobacillus inulinus]